jgi:hypothetical protein
MLRIMLAATPLPAVQLWAYWFLTRTVVKWIILSPSWGGAAAAALSYNIHN